MHNFIEFGILIYQIIRLRSVIVVRELVLADWTNFSLNPLGKWLHAFFDIWNSFFSPFLVVVLWKLSWLHILIDEWMLVVEFWFGLLGIFIKSNHYVLEVYLRWTIQLISGLANITRVILWLLVHLFRATFDWIWFKVFILYIWLLWLLIAYFKIETNCWRYILRWCVDRCTLGIVVFTELLSELLPGKLAARLVKYLCAWVFCKMSRECVLVSGLSYRLRSRALFIIQWLSVFLMSLH